MAQIETDSFQHIIRHHANFHKSTISGGGNKKEMAKQTREIIFGFNRKQDNQQKTKQLNLWNTTTIPH